MSERSYLFTSESVTEGHPDKVADNVSDAVLDALLAQDPNSRVACETMISTGFCIIAGEVTSQAQVDLQQIVRDTICDIGYTGGDSGFDGRTCAVMVALDKQSPHIAMGVDEGEGKEQGAGDQGMMFGYATRETPQLMPLPILLSHQIGLALSHARKSGAIPWLQPDGKSQVTIEYDESGRPMRIHTVVVSNQHSPSVSNDEIRKTIIEQIIKPTLPQEYVNGDEIIYHINPTGRFEIGGPVGDCGLTGRKIIVDTYGGMGRHGGGAFSGKDASKVDRSAAYMARYMAKNVVAAGIAERCEVQLAYAIGVAEPVSIHATTFGESEIDDAKLSRVLREVFDCRPAAIVKQLDLKRPQFRATAAYGHFGREDAGFRWEETDRVDDLRKAAGL